MRRLCLQKNVIKELASLPAKQYRQVVGAILELLGDATPHYSRPLRGSAYHRIAVGEYRVVYRFDDENVFILVAGKRNDGEIYELAKRRN